MRVKFLRTEVVPQNAGDIVYREGEIYDLRDDQVARWLRRGAVVEVPDDAEDDSSPKAGSKRKAAKASKPETPPAPES